MTTSAWHHDVERIIASDLGDPSLLSVDELRSRRDDCRRVEDKVSYLRRLAQGRLDIVAADLRRRADGSSSPGLLELVEQLPEILRDRTRPSGPGRLPTSLAPPDEAGDLTAELDALAPAGVLAHLADETDESVQELASRLQGLERAVSDARRALFDRIDVLQAELALRYKSGEASVGSVLDQS